MARFLWLAALLASRATAAAPLRVEQRQIDRKLPGCGDARNGCVHVSLDYVEARRSTSKLTTASTPMTVCCSFFPKTSGRSIVRSEPHPPKRTQVRSPQHFGESHESGTRCRALGTSRARHNRLGSSVGVPSGVVFVALTP